MAGFYAFVVSYVNCLTLLTSQYWHLSKMLNQLAIRGNGDVFDMLD